MVVGSNPAIPINSLSHLSIVYIAKLSFNKSLFFNLWSINDSILRPDCFTVNISASVICPSVVQASAVFISFAYHSIKIPLAGAEIFLVA